MLKVCDVQNATEMRRYLWTTSREECEADLLDSKIMEGTPFRNFRDGHKAQFR